MNISYIIKEGFSGFKRTRLASITSVTALVIAVLLLSVIARFGYSGYQLIQSLKESVEVEVFLFDISEERTQTIGRQLEEYSIVTRAIYVDKEEAEAVFRKEFGTEGETLADLRFLPASFILQLSPGASVPEILKMIQEIESYQGVDEVVFNQRLLETLEDRYEIIALSGAGIGFFVLLTAIILVFNTIRLTIYAKRNIIRTMKLVGATKGFIRRPFLFEGFLQGVVAALISIGIHILLFQWIIPHYLPQLGVLAWPFDQWYYLAGAMLFLSLLMGLLGSSWATRKFIHQTTLSG